MSTLLTRTSIIIQSLDHIIPISKGKVFAREWRLVEASRTTLLQPIVLLHDSLGCVDLWREFPERLCKETGRRVIAYDRYGYGRSEARREKMPLTFIAEEATELLPQVIKNLQLSKPFLLGHSVGGGMSLSYASVFPDACSGVITIAAQSFLEEQTIQGILSAKEAFANPDHFDRLQKYHGENARWVLDAWTETWLHPTYANWNLKQVLPSITCPVLAIHGDKDEYGCIEQPALITSLVQGEAHKVLLPACGHVPHREHPQEVLAHIRTFLYTKS
jgi:pimeloyl-ACP methyl ester carboxylesterase